MRKDLPYQNRTFAKVFLLSGNILEGHVFIDLPKTHTRLSDFLNFSKKFFFIEVDEQDFLVNTKFVKMVMPVCNMKKDPIFIAALDWGTS